MDYQLGKSSRKKLIGLNPILAFAVCKAIELTEQDFTVFEGLRNIATQRHYVNIGSSWTLRSHHLTGDAVDLIPYEVGRGVSWDFHEEFVAISVAMKSIIIMYELPISWGYDLWGKDAGHWQMKKGHRGWMSSKSASKLLKSIG